MDDVVEAVDLAPSETDEVKQTVELTSEGTASEAGDEVAQAEPEKKFTQAELDAAIQKRLLKEERRVHRRVEQQHREKVEARAREVVPVRESFRDDDEFLNAQIEHLAEKKAAEKFEARERIGTQEKAQEAFLERAELVKAKHSDFEAVVGNPSLAINESMAEFIGDSVAGPDIAYFLGKNPAKAQEIAGMSPIKAARELSAIEAQVSAPKVVKTSKAPAPITPVGTSGRAPPSIANADFSEYKKLRQSQGARWAR